MKQGRKILKRLKPFGSKQVIRVLGVMIFILGLSSASNAQNFPKLGNDTLLDVACWNTEWFGDVNYGPSDEATQYNNVKAMLDRTDFDVFAMEEISSASTYNTLSNAVSAKYDTYISTYSQTQKTGIFWKKSMFNVIGVNTLNLSLNSSDNYAFASRPPLQVCLQTIGGTKTDTLYFLVVHMKAQTESSDAGRFESYTRRQNASIALKNYLETTLNGKKYIVLGDWNDDLDASIYNSLETPYKNFLNASYTFPSRELTLAGKSSYAFNTNMIDHMLNSKTLDSFYYISSARVFDDAASYCAGFSNNTSDHFPVYAFYNWKKLTTRIVPQGIESIAENISIQVYPNPSNTSVFIECDKPVSSLVLYDIHGKAVWQKEEIMPGTLSERIDMSSLPSGVYFLKVELDGASYFKQIIRQ